MSHFENNNNTHPQPTPRYSEKCVAVIGELATAMESDGGGVVVVLADHPSKVDYYTLHSNYYICVCVC